MLHRIISTRHSMFIVRNLPGMDRPRRHFRGEVAQARLCRADGRHSPRANMAWIVQFQWVDAADGYIDILVLLLSGRERIGLLEY